MGTRAYDLGELYAKYLHGRRGSDAQSSKRIRRAEQFQVFLALALLALLADAFTRPNRASLTEGERPEIDARSAHGRDPVPRAVAAPLAVTTSVILAASIAGSSRADNPADAVREGLPPWQGRIRQGQTASRQPASNSTQRIKPRPPSPRSTRPLPLHRKGDVAQAREWYLKAGLAHDKGLAAAAHFNLGTLSAEEGTVWPEKTRRTCRLKSARRSSTS